MLTAVCCTCVWRFNKSFAISLQMALNVTGEAGVPEQQGKSNTSPRAISPIPVRTCENTIKSPRFYFR